MSDIFDSTTEVETKQKEENIVNFTPDYLELNLTSEGKLRGTPSKLHIRNYNGEEISKLSLLNDNNRLKTILNVLKSVIQEDINISDLHLSDVKEILLTIYINYWNKYIKEWEYPISDEELEILEKKDQDRYKAYKKGLTPLTIDLEIASSLIYKTLPKDFKEPIIVPDPDTNIEYGFILPRVYHIIELEDHLDELYFIREQEFSSLQKRLQYNIQYEGEDGFVAKTIPKEEYEAYSEFLTEKEEERLIYNMTQLLISKNGKELTYEEKRHLIEKEINPDLLNYYRDLLTTYNDFGIQNRVKVKSPITKKPVERRLEFRLDSILPTLDKETTRKYGVRFGV